MAQRVLMVPGLRGSGAAHWQSLWQARHPEYVRVLQRDWAAPRLDDWVAALAAAAADKDGAVLVAHGFGCLAVIGFLQKKSNSVRGVMLVAPRDPEDFGLAPDSFQKPEIPAVLVASRNDPDMPFTSARRLARRLGSRFVDAGEAGHIDAAGGYGPWPRGERLLGALIDAAQARERELRVALALGA